MIGQQVQVQIDRPLGSKHPKHELIYPINYGYVNGIMGGDGEEQDVYVLGVNHPIETFTGQIIAIVKRYDDVEEKWVAAPAGVHMTKAEIEEQLQFQEQYFRHEILMKEIDLTAVIFDMDGLMIDSERVTYEGYVAECKRLGYPMDKAFYRKILGLPRPSIMQCFHQQFGAAFPFDEVIQRVHAYMADQFATQGVPLKPGLLELLTYLRQTGIKTMVATSSNRQRVDQIFDQAGLHALFDDSICGNEVTRGKPHPDIFLKACEKLGVHPSQALVLEDSEAGIQAASAAGIPVICVPDMKYPEARYAKETEHILPSLIEVQAYIQLIRT